MMDSTEKQQILEHFYGGKYQDPKMRGLLDLADALVYLIKTGARVHELRIVWKEHQHPRRVEENMRAYEAARRLENHPLYRDAVKHDWIHQLPLVDYLRVRFLRRQTYGAVSADDTCWMHCDNCGKYIKEIIGSGTLTRCQHCGTAYYTDFVVYRVSNPPPNRTENVDA